MTTRARRALVVAVTFAAVASWPPAARAGHEFPFYPSYYPQEITVRVVSPADAAPKLRDGSLHAYVGADPFRGGPTPGNVTRVESLEAYVVVTLNVAAPFFGDAPRRCRAARAVTDALQWGPPARRHGYPVTPYHPDYLQHADLARAAEAGAPDPWDGPPLRIRAADPAAQALVPAAQRATAGRWDATVETREVAGLWTRAAVGPNGDVGPPWLKAGWSHAYLVLRDAIVDGAVRQRVDVLHERLASGRVADLVERLTLERRLVSTLARSCERVVAGYTLRAEPLHVEYSGGVENVAHDAQAGLNSAIFPRTVKLKDFPWNGWLTVGVPARPEAAWNPVAGFTDATGRLLWSALSDTGFFPAPHGSGWAPNRLVVAESEAGAPALPVPEDALAPEPGTGVWRKLPPGRRAGARVVYRVLGSRFHDGTKLEVADLLHALGFAWRAKEASVARATARLREGLVGLRVLRTETDVLAFGEDKLTYEVPIVEVFVARPGDDPRAAALAVPPWTTVPWHLLALAEEAVARGLAAFSREGAEARGLPWLDLARDPRLGPRLSALLDELERQRHVPAALSGRVTPDEAQARWAALRAFREAAGHLLVTNGPYRLAEWDEGKTVLRVFRDLSYPRGVGVFNSHAIPLRAYVTEAEARGDELVLRGDLERVERFGREHRVVRERFVKRAVEQDRRSLPVGHYVAVAPDGSVAAAGSVDPADPGDFPVDLRALGRPGRYVLLVALTVDDNRTLLPVKVVPWTR
jgi:hypothetical protein